MTHLFFPCFVPVLPCCRACSCGTSQSSPTPTAAADRKTANLHPLASTLPHSSTINGANTCANRKERMHQVERTCISLRQFRHNLVIVIGDGALADADESHCGQQPNRIAACEQHAHSDAGAGGQQNKRLFQPEIQRQKACTETGLLRSRSTAPTAAYRPPDNSGHSPP